MQPRPKFVAATYARAAFTVICCVLFVCGAALALSGRRQQKPVEIAPVPTPTPEPTPLPPAPPAELIGIMLLSDDSLSFDTPSYYSDLMRDVVGQRLREAKSFDITGGAKPANRSEAHKLAKLEKKRFVIWFRLVTRGAFGGSDIMGQNEEFQIEFVILEPATGKQAGSGRAYPGTGRGRVGGIGLPRGGCYPTGTTRDNYQLVEAAIEAADRVIQHFSVPLPPRCS